MCAGVWGGGVKLLVQLRGGRQESKSLTLDDKRDWTERRRDERRDPREERQMKRRKDDEVEGKAEHKGSRNQTHASDNSWKSK